MCRLPLIGVALSVVVAGCRHAPPAASPVASLRVEFSVNDPYVIGCIRASVRSGATAATVTLDSVELRWRRVAPPMEIGVEVFLARQIFPDSVRSNWNAAISTLAPIPLVVGPNGKLGARGWVGGIVLACRGHLERHGGDLRARDGNA
jgi:hypothetical protein